MELHKRITAGVHTQGLPAIVAATLLTAWSNAANAEDMRGYLLASSCLVCHNEGAPRDSAIPTLAARDVDFIASEMTRYRDGTRDGTIMPRLARGYSDTDIALISQWLAKRGATRTTDD